MSQAMIRGVMDETGEQFVAYFLPTSETLTKRARDASQSVDYDDNDEYDYKMARQYHWNVKSKASKGYEENYFIVFRDDAVYYNELETRVRLTKRRPKPGEPATSNTRLVLKHRSLTSREHRMFRQRERQLEPANQAEDEEEMEEDDEEIDEDEGGAVGGQRVIKDDDKEDEGKEDADSDAQSDRSRSRSRSKSKSPRSASSGGSSSRSRSSSAASSHRSASPVPVKVEDQPRDQKYFQDFTCFQFSRCNVIFSLLGKQEQQWQR
jgi:RNA polymerase II-associated factor 1